MQVDSSSIIIPGANIPLQKTEYRMKSVFIPIENHPSSDEFKKLLEMPQEEQWKLWLLALQLRDYNTEIDKTWSNNDFQIELKNTKKEHNSQVKKFRDKNKKLKEKITSLENKIQEDIQEYDTNLEQTRIKSKLQVENLYKNKVNTLEEDISNLKTSLSTKDKGFYEEIDKKSIEIRSECKKELEKLRNDKEAELKELRERLYRETSNEKVAVNKGSAGEELVSKWLTSYFPTGEIEDTAQQGGRGDMILTYKKKKFLIEVKTDKKNVQTAGVKKFEKEMVSLEDIDGGVFLSLNSGVSGKPDWTIQMYGEKPAIYLCNVKECPKTIIGGIDFLRQLMMTNMNVQNVEATAKAIKNYKKNLLCNVKKIKNQIKDNNDILMKSFDRIDEDVVKFVNQMLNDYSNN